MVKKTAQIIFLSICMCFSAHADFKMPFGSCSEAQLTSLKEPVQVKQSSSLVSFGFRDVISTKVAAEPYKGMRFTALEAGSTVSMQAVGTTPPTLNLQYSEDEGLTWKAFNVGTTTVVLQKCGDSIVLKGQNTAFASSSTSYNKFNLTGKLAASGDITTILQESGNALSLPSYAFTYLFSQQNALVDAYDLVIPSTNLESYACARMFFNCHGLKSSPRVFAKVISQRSCFYMFYGCTSLENAFDIVADTISTAGCSCMFYGCTSLVKAPKIHAKSIAAQGCRYMFQNCTALKRAPKLTASTLSGNYAYQYMFAGCTSLETAPEIMATNTTSYCFQYMFQGCTSLAKVPPLRICGDASNCMAKMFAGCSKLSKLTFAFKTWGQTSEWLLDVAPSGVVVCPHDLGTNSTIERGADRVPYGWDVINPLCFQAAQANSSISMTKGQYAPSIALKTSPDMVHWSDFTPGDDVITLYGVGDRAYFIAGASGNERICGATQGQPYANTFAGSGSIACRGDIVSLLTADARVSDLTDRPLCFQYLFYDFDALTTVPRISVARLGNGCCLAMCSVPNTNFSEIDCTDVEAAPADSLRSVVRFTSAPPTVITFGTSLMNLNGSALIIATQIQGTAATLNLRFEFTDSDTVLFDPANIVVQGSQKTPHTYNIYTDNTTIKNAAIAKKNSYTTVNIYYLNGMIWD